MKHKRYYYGIDILRIICAIGITLLHLRPFEDILPAVDFFLTCCITRIAVPTFFCISCFLFFEDKDIEKLEWSALVGYLRRVWGSYIAYTFIYMPLIIVNFGTEKYQGYTLWMKVAIFVRRFLFIGSWTPLWFFLSLGTVMTIIFVLLKLKCSVKTIAIGSALLYMTVGVGNSAWTNCYEVVWKKMPILQEIGRLAVGIMGPGALNFVFGLMFCSLGLVMAQKILWVGRKVSFWCEIVAILCLVTAVHLAKSMLAVDYTMTTSMIAVVFFLVNYTTEVVLEGRMIYGWFRKMSVLIYGLHPLFAEVIGFKVSCVRYGCVMFFVLLVAVAIIKMQNKFRWLKVLY